MKIAFIGQKGIPMTYGGVEKHVEELALRLVKEGHQVSAYCRKWYTGSLLPNYKGVDLLYTKSINTKNLDAITGTFTATIDALGRGFDVIHYHGVGPALLSFIPRIFSPKTKVVVTFHCQDKLHGKWGLFAKLMLSLGERAACYFPNQTIVVSKTLKDYTDNKYHCKANYIPNGVTLPVASEATDILPRFGLKKNSYILSVTRLVSHKSVHHLISAFNALKKENSQELTQDLKLVIVGEGVHTDKYVKFIKDLAIGNPDIVFVGWQGGKDLNTLYTNAKLFVHPSISEGLPLVVLEAMSYGLPVIVSDILEHQELITD
ncbi:MAG: glycosyltransferase family 4 protein, partial [Candidatus Magasanikbacteria bacterium]|nr:glycosyltransferase family 4 protein [Candidatus Magasanikbacteria bacterium]